MNKLNPVLLLNLLCSCESFARYASHDTLLTYFLCKRTTIVLNFQPDFCIDAKFCVLTCKRFGDFFTDGLQRVKNLRFSLHVGLTCKVFLQIISAANLANLSEFWRFFLEFFGGLGEFF